MKRKSWTRSKVKLYRKTERKFLWQKLRLQAMRIISFGLSYGRRTRHPPYAHVYHKEYGGLFYEMGVERTILQLLLFLLFIVLLQWKSVFKSGYRSGLSLERRRLFGRNIIPTMHGSDIHMDALWAGGRPSSRRRRVARCCVE